MADEHVNKTIEMVEGQITSLFNELRVKKLMVNGLCELAGLAPRYPDAEQESRRAATTIRSDEYYGKPIATVVRAILERRGAANLGAASVNEIYEEMVAGGYHFGGKNEDNNKRGLYITLGKNTTAFHKLPNGRYGLRGWYPDIKGSKDTKGKGNGTEAQGNDEKPLHEELQNEKNGSPAPAVKTAK
jgi:hypothetical protein